MRIACLTDDRSTEDQVGSGHGEDRVGSVIALDTVVSVLTKDRIIILSAEDIVIAASGSAGIEPAVGYDRVVTGDRVLSWSTLELVATEIG